MPLCTPSSISPPSNHAHVPTVISDVTQRPHVARRNWHLVQSVLDQKKKCSFYTYGLHNRRKSYIWVLLFLCARTHISQTRHCHAIVPSIILSMQNESQRPRGSSSFLFLYIFYQTRRVLPCSPSPLSFSYSHAPRSLRDTRSSHKLHAHIVSYV